MWFITLIQSARFSFCNLYGHTYQHPYSYFLDTTKICIMVLYSLSTFNYAVHIHFARLVLFVFLLAYSPSLAIIVHLIVRFMYNKTLQKKIEPIITGMGDWYTYLTTVTHVIHSFLVFPENFGHTSLLK